MKLSTTCAQAKNQLNKENCYLCYICYIIASLLQLKEFNLTHSLHYNENFYFSSLQKDDKDDMCVHVRLVMLAVGNNPVKCG